MNGLILTESNLEAVGFSPVKDLRRARRAHLHALTAQKNGYVDGAGIEHPPTPDHPTQLRASVEFYKLYGLYPDKGAPSLTGGGNLTIVWDVSATEVPPVSARTALSSTASAASNGSPAWSATADGERPPSA